MKIIIVFILAKIKSFAEANLGYVVSVLLLGFNHRAVLFLTRPRFLPLSGRYKTNIIIKR
jgi:hypothetical protein